MLNIIKQIIYLFGLDRLNKYIAASLTLFLFINFNIFPFSMLISRVLVLYIILLLIYIKYPLSKDQDKSKLKIIDCLFIFLVIFNSLFFYFKLIEFMNFSSIGTPLYQIVFATISLILILEATRRVTGPILPIMAIIFILYSILHGYRYARIITEIISFDGVFGVTFSLVISVIFIFLLLGNILNEANFGKFLISFGNSTVGGMRGGPAKVAVVSSALFGSISGSAVANVVTTGTFTIPLMKKLGFEPHIAGGVEASASCGGGITPPIMAAAGFLIAEILQIPYREVASAAILPALGYYICIFAAIDSYSGKLGIKGIPKKERPSLRESMSEGGHLLFILLILIYLLAIRIQALRAAFYAILITIPLSFVNKKTMLNFSKISNVLVNTGDSLLTLGSIGATCGCILACMGLTGAGVQLSSSIIKLTSGNLMGTLFLTMVLCLLFTMSLPTTASYLVLVSITVPALIRLNVLPIAAHMFILYYCALSGLTPPVAVASFAAAGIAGSSLTKTAFSGLKMALIAFIIPYIFVYYPALLFHPKHLNLVFAIILFVLILPLSLAWSLWGYSFNKILSIYERLFYFSISVIIFVLCVSGYFIERTFAGYAIIFTFFLLSFYSFQKSKDKRDSSL